MHERLWSITDVFEIAGRGVVIAGDLRECDPCPNVPIGHVLQVRRPDGTVMDFPVFSIGFIDPPNPERHRHFMLSGAFTAGDVPIGSELWHLGDP